MTEAPGETEDPAVPGALPRDSGKTMIIEVFQEQPANVSVISRRHHREVGGPG